jgi:hypothetical protein
MRADDLLRWVKATPFQPFRIQMNSGRAYEIRHPEMVSVGRSTAHIFTYRGEPTGPWDQAEMVSLMLMERVEPMQNTKSRKGNKPSE